jgi:hypothetical protein
VRERKIEIKIGAVLLNNIQLAAHCVGQLKVMKLKIDFDVGKGE